ncbi:BnaA02g09780D [Brassica napus]|uniref:BnaA02g09780D protein n=1 Tax=Brassica napus TaxID=3708 RepID=A0A078GTG2_BRANA|nr:BnaA02g09780D [Brassica napus]
MATEQEFTRASRVSGRRRRRRDGRN